METARCDGRGDWIRTSDLPVPNRTLHQAEPHPDMLRLDGFSHLMIPICLSTSGPLRKPGWKTENAAEKIVGTGALAARQLIDRTRSRRKTAFTAFFSAL
jgi:hypothetical protein